MWAGREPAELAPSLDHAHPLRGCLAQPGPASMAALTVVVTQPDPETISRWVSVWRGLDLWFPQVLGIDVFEGPVLFPGGGE